MSKLQYKKGLLYTSIELKYGEWYILIEDVIIDTGVSMELLKMDLF